MVLGWRRAFCTSISRDREPKVAKKKNQVDTSNSNPAPTPSPRISSKFGFFSNPSTPRLQSQSVSSPSLRCRTSVSKPATPPPLSTDTAAAPPPAVPESPKLQCKTKNSPRFFQWSSPSSPRSPSTFSLLKSTLRLSKNRCGICLQNIKSGQGTAIFTAECSHSFHFPCVAAHVRKQRALTCPICNSTWKEMPILSSTSATHQLNTTKPDDPNKKIKSSSSPKLLNDNRYTRSSSLNLKVYNDDEPLMSPTSGARFNPIPESDEEIENGDFQGFFVNANMNLVNPVVTLKSSRVEVRMSPEAAVVSVGRSSETYVVVLKLRGPPAPVKAARRAPIDLVAVIDVRGKMTADVILLMKRALRLIVSSLSDTDRMSIVAFSSTSKRLLPLRRMTTAGRRSARRIIEAIVSLDGTFSCANDALKKAAKVLDDRREKNAVASIVLLSDTNSIADNSNHRNLSPLYDQARQSSFVSSTRFSQSDIPVHAVNLHQVISRACEKNAPPSEDMFDKSITGIVSVVIQDLTIQLGFISGSAPADIAAVYSNTGRPASLGSGSVKLGDLYAEEERELLIELKVPSLAIGSHHLLSVRCSYKDPSTQEPVHCKEQALLVPRPHAVRSSTPGIEWLRCLFVFTRAVAESRRLTERNDLTGARHMLTSARALLMQSSFGSEEFLRCLEAELAELQPRRQNQVQQVQRRRNPTNNNNNTGNNDAQVVERELGVAYVDEKGEPLTPTSAWRAAERLAKVAIMRKSLNRVSDLHGFENARF